MGHNISGGSLSGVESSAHATRGSDASRIGIWDFGLRIADFKMNFIDFYYGTGPNNLLILGILAHFRQFRHLFYVSPTGLAQHLAQ
jgi:hypothetical protein